MSSYVFFLSYARADFDPYLEQFVKTLVTELRRNKSFPADQAIEFFDQPEIERGADWEKKLVDGLQGAQVFIPLYSPNYFASEYSGKEWAFFHERCGLYQPPAGGNVFPPLIKPVIWIPPASKGRAENQTTELPKTVNAQVKKLQYTRGEQRANANVNGVRSLVRRLNDENKTEYLDYLDALVKEIIAAIEEFVAPQLNPAPALSAVPAAFPISLPAAAAPAAGAAARADSQGAQPNKRVGFIVIAASAAEVPATRLKTSYGPLDREDWQPFLPKDSEQVAFVVQNIAQKLKVLSEFIQFERRTFRQRMDEALGRGQVVILLVDGWTLTLGGDFVDLLSEFDGGNYDNCGVVIPRNPDDSDLAQHENAVKKALAKALYRRLTVWNPLFMRQDVPSREEFEAHLEDLITRLRATVVNSRAPERELPLSDIQKAAVRSQ